MGCGEKQLISFILFSDQVVDIRLKKTLLESLSNPISFWKLEDFLYNLWVIPLMTLMTTTFGWSNCARWTARSACTRSLTTIPSHTAITAPTVLGKTVRLRCLLIGYWRFRLVTALHLLLPPSPKFIRFWRRHDMWWTIPTMASSRRTGWISLI